MMLLTPDKEEEESFEIKEYDVGIIGLGPAGLTSAIYTSRAGLSVVVIGKDYGGQMGLALEIENYPGFENISGMELTDRMKNQAEKFGAKIVFAEADDIYRKEDRRFLIKTDMGEYLVKALILATGGRHRELNVPGEKEFIGRGVSYCATCDASFFKEKTVVVVGSGDAAATGTLALSDVGAKKIYWVSRSDYMKCEKIYLERAAQRDNIEILYNKQVAEIKGTNTVEEIVFNDGTTLKADGIFAEIGNIPNTELAAKLGIELEDNLIKIDDECRTNIEGVFAAGDVTSKIKNPLSRQVTTSVGLATIAAISTADYLQARYTIQG
ncbi:MAG: FAD-dependent oxidoreductase [Candidatus Heimdallarchaeum endolithica]|uniref:FAD-dependent oxidoreductase n=1 Tax=Candidatus Heimdallarchaeum endolithica TaxID=2876572 RepID=A0A9Y1BTK3_9ARCH|nr:MAG: FAD-dependent oxidoreductase [Candidatus Heimdallarchaeum endolithica]